MSTSTGPSTTTQQVLDSLRREIIGGLFYPGERVGQEELAQHLGVSIAPVREALRILEQEGQVTYYPRRGYFVTQLCMADLEEIYGLRATLEARAARRALEAINDMAIELIGFAAEDCVKAVAADDVLAELAANRRFHMAILEPADLPHTLRIIQMLWDSTEAYRALYYNSRDEREESLRAHERIMDALRQHDADLLVHALDEHRNRALTVLGGILE